MSDSLFWRVDMPTNDTKHSIKDRHAYEARWKSDIYRQGVRSKAIRLNSDGCTGVPEFYRDG